MWILRPFLAAPDDRLDWLEMVTTAKLREMIRKTWNFAVAAEREKQKETT